MDERLLEVLRCPFCGGRLNLLDNAALVRERDRIESAVIWCACCAFPIVAGIPVLKADDASRAAILALEDGRHEEALLTLLDLEGDRAEAFRTLVGGPDATYRAAIAVLSPDPEGTYFVYRFSDPTFVMAEALLEALTHEPAAFRGRVLDLCGGSGHLSRVLTTSLPDREVILADVYFWKLWLARTFTAPRAAGVCCDANQPLPFLRAACPTVVLSDAFPYIWHKRLLADEMLRLAGPGGTVVMPHLHSALGENFSAGMTLTPEAYRDLFAELGARLFSDERLLDQAIAGAGIDLNRDFTPEELGVEASVTLVASRQAPVFRQLPSAQRGSVRGVLTVNPLYEIEPRGSWTHLTLRFPNAEYAEEFDACRRYLPDQLDLEGVVTGIVTPGAVGDRLPELRRRRVILDLPPRYC